MDKNNTTLQLIKPCGSADGMANSMPDVDAPWMGALAQLLKPTSETDTEASLAAFGNAVKFGSSIAARIARLAQNPLDQLVLAGLFLEGQDIGLRKALRIKDSTMVQIPMFNPDNLTTEMEPATVLTATRLVEWLGGKSASWQGQVAQRLLPQAGLAAKHLILRGTSSTPLEGGVRLTPFLASLLYPGDGSDERRLDDTLILSRPKERLSDVVLKEKPMADLKSFIKLCKSKDGPGRAALLWGRAGTGKTLSARAICGELGLPLLLVRTMGSGREPYLLERAAAAATIEGAGLFFDECGRWVDSKVQESGPPPEATMLLQILQDHPGVIMAAMNQGWYRMSEAFQRRFQVQVVYGGPEPTERVELWKRLLKRPAASKDMEQVAKRFPLSGGLIKNAASRLDAESPDREVTLSELEDAARAQFTLILDWKKLSILVNESLKFQNLKARLERETRRELASLGLRLRRSALLSIRGGYVNFGFKACLWSPLSAGRGGDYYLELAALYVARMARLKPLTKSLDDFRPQDFEQTTTPKSSVDLRQSLSAAAMTGHLPIMSMDEVPDLRGGTEQADALRDFISFTGVGLLLPRRVAGFKTTFAVGEWICVKPTEFKDVQGFLKREFPDLNIEILIRDLRERLKKIGVASIPTVVRWAMTRDKNVMKVPARLSAASISEAIDAYERKPGIKPAFHS